MDKIPVFAEEEMICCSLRLMEVIAPLCVHKEIENILYHCPRFMFMNVSL